MSPQLKMSRNHDLGRWFARITAIGTNLRNSKKIQVKTCCFMPCHGFLPTFAAIKNDTGFFEVFPNLGDLDGLTMREQKSRYEASS